jgi:hypothetical protein
VPLRSVTLSHFAGSTASLASGGGYQLGGSSGHWPQRTLSTWPVLLVTWLLVAQMVPRPSSIWPWS